MCGIAGMVSPAGLLPDAGSLTRITAVITHRGPDGAAQWRNTRNTVCLGHRRLKIIDLTDAAAQPMHWQNRYAIVHNGEMYNYTELRETLAAKGMRFQTASDTEVILAAYAFFGEDCLQHLHGMFAFAIWDEQEQKLFAARDRFGEKPFYYHVQPDVFSFASEIKALWAAGIEKQPDPEMMLLYLGGGFTNIPEQPERTFYSNISSLPAGHALTVHSGETIPRIYRYWKPDITNTIQLEPEAAIEQFRVLFSESVKKRLRSDVPAGTCLSGGLDSSSVVAECRKINASNYQHTCFTASFPGFKKDETALSAETASLFGLKQVLVTPAAGDLSADLEKMLYHQERPVISSSAYAQYRVFQAAKENGITVLLDGQGADETLAGYYRYLHWYLQELVWKHPVKMNRERNGIRKNGLPLQWGIKNFAAALFPKWAAGKLQQRAVQEIQHRPGLNREWVDTYFKPSAIFKPPVKNLNDILYFTTLQQGLPDLLHMADRNSMAHGVEVRLPFLDHKLVEFLFSLPAQYKIHDGFTKWILRKAMEPVLPGSVVWNTKKTGFETPQKEWLNHAHTKEMIAAAKQKLQRGGILNPPKANDTGAPDDDETAWRYLCAAAFTG